MANYPRLPLLLPDGIEQRVRRQGIAVRPEADRDAFNILRRVESRFTKHAAQLVADVSLKSRKRCLQQLRAPSAILVPLRQSGLAGSAQHEKDCRLLAGGPRPLLS